MDPLCHRLPLHVRTSLLTIGVLLCLPAAATAAPGPGPGVVHTPHYRVTLGIMPVNQLAGTAALRALDRGYARRHDSAPISSSVAVQSGSGEVLSAAVYTRRDGRQLHHLQLTATVRPSHSWQGTRQAMYPVRINGHVTYETLVPMPPGSYTVRLGIANPAKGGHEIATFSRSIQ